MPSSHRLRAVLGLAILTALMPGRAISAPMYTIIDLGSRYVTGLNDSGEVVGAGSLSGPDTGSPYLYQNGTFTELSRKVGSAWVSGINNAGQIVGTSPTAGGGSNGFVLSPDGQLTTYANSSVVAINNNGDTLVQSYPHVYLNQNGTTTDLNHLAQGQSLAPTGLSDAGHVIGFGSTSFVYQNGKLTDLASLGGGGTEPRGVNAAGQVVGFSSTSSANQSDTMHAFLYQNGKMTDLGTLGGPRSYAWAINAQGQVVGTSDYLPGTANPYSHAFLYENGTMFDLNKLVPAGSAWVLEEAQGINIQGQIVGNGIGPNGQAHSFLLTPTSGTANPPPIPEPSIVAFFGLAALGLAVRHMGRRSC